MKYTAQVIYPEFVELFNVELNGNNLDVKLDRVISAPSDSRDILTLDLAHDVKQNYSAFPLEDGDLLIIQLRNHFVIANFLNGEKKWYRFSAEDVLEYLLTNDVTQDVIPFVKEDKFVLLNAVLSDLVRNDFSYSALNKRVKHLKVHTLVSFIKDNIHAAYTRVILDETVLGDVDIEHVVMAFRKHEEKFVRLVKINNVAKILVLLEKEKVLPKHFAFIDDVSFINNPKQGETVKLIFGENSMKFDYQVMPSKNYIFDLSNKEYALTIGHDYKVSVRGKVFVYNGDERDLMIE